MKPVIHIDGSTFETLEGFFECFSNAALDGSRRGRNLDAFNDVLRGGFGTPDGGFVMVWVNHETSRQRLGYAETRRQLSLRRERCHPANIPLVDEDIERANRNQGATVYDWLLGIISVHGPGGSEAEDGVDLELR